MLLLPIHGDPRKPRLWLGKKADCSELMSRQTEIYRYVKEENEDAIHCTRSREEISTCGAVRDIDRESISYYYEYYSGHGVRSTYEVVLLSLRIAVFVHD